MNNLFSPVDLRAADFRIDDFWRNPGWYRWWARREDCKELLGPQCPQLLPDLTEGEGPLQDHVLVYIGITKETLFSRVVNWHVREKHRPGSIKHRTLSTFRQTISSLTAGNWADEAATNRAIDRLRNFALEILCSVVTSLEEPSRTR